MPRPSIDLLGPVTDVTCGKCGNRECVIYPRKESPHGMMVCPTCTPAWMADAIKRSSEQYIAFVRAGGKAK